MPASNKLFGGAVSLMMLLLLFPACGYHSHYTGRHAVVGSLSRFQSDGRLVGKVASVDVRSGEVIVRKSVYLTEDTVVCIPSVSPSEPFVITLMMGTTFKCVPSADKELSNRVSAGMDVYIRDGYPENAAGQP